MSDLISRQAAIDELSNGALVNYQFAGHDNGLVKAIDVIKGLPPAGPEIIRCRDCKHWRDSDGVYRRGIDAESKCPLNIQEVYAGTFYCGYAERRDE